MQDSTRRGFLALAGTSAVAGAALVAAPGASATPTTTEDDRLPQGAEKSLTAYVRDSAKGELVLMSDNHEVVVTDRKLVARLARAFDQANR